MRKRYTYAFSEFVRGIYRSGDNAALSGMFSRMTANEKWDILSLNFEQMWYRLWLDSPRKNGFYIAKNKFEAAFLGDGTNRLRRLICNSDTADLVWEMPKGKRRGQHESLTRCAVREFEEETGIKKSEYRIMPGTPLKRAAEDGGNIYESTYFVAHTERQIRAKLKYKVNCGAEEISMIKWLPLPLVAALAPDMHDLARRAVQIVRRRRARSELS